MRSQRLAVRCVYLIKLALRIGDEVGQNTTVCVAHLIAIILEGVDIKLNLLALGLGLPDDAVSLVVGVLDDAVCLNLGVRNDVVGRALGNDEGSGDGGRIGNFLGKLLLQVFDLLLKFDDVGRKLFDVVLIVLERINGVIQSD